MKDGEQIKEKGEEAGIIKASNQGGAGKSMKIKETRKGGRN